MSEALSSPKVLIGPWRGEVGTEVTYWQPWLQRVAAGIWEKSVVVSRGGLGRLYHPGVETVDLYAIRGVESVVAENLRAKAEFGVNKPVMPTGWEREVAAEVGSMDWLHPGSMVQACARYWHGEAGMQTLAGQMDVTPLVKPPKPDWLPGRYTALRWYFREGVLDERVDAAWRQIEAGLHGPVVWVGAGGGFDRHVEGGRQSWMLAMPDGPVEDNLYRQAAVIAHADRFVGTYGGLAQLALRLGVPTVALYPDKEPKHRAFNQWIAHKTDVPFISGSLSDVDVMRSVFA